MESAALELLVPAASKATAAPRSMLNWARRPVLVPTFQNFLSFTVLNFMNTYLKPGSVSLF